MSDDDSGGDGGGGKGRPPKASQFPKGVSGNPAGRPRGRHKLLPYETVLGRKVQIVVDGVAVMIETGHALVLQLRDRALRGSSPDARDVLELYEKIRPLLARSATPVHEITMRFIRPGGVNTALRPLRMATRLYPYETHARMAIEPWLVEAALARLGERQLTIAEQATVVAATRTPYKVKWPAWWSAQIPQRGVTDAAG